jgi:cleavage and polyadenylation specificity factor subunit 2
MALLTNVAHSTVEFAKSLLEWMSDSIAKSFESSRENSFLLKYLKLCHKRKEFDELQAGPKVYIYCGYS